MEEMFFTHKSNKGQSVDRIKISIASPEQIKSWSSGEVVKPETINYRTFKPEPGGLFCMKIFGPNKSYECACGKYKRIKYKGTICEKCEVEVTSSQVRRERMGHIKLAAPVAHIWFLKSPPSRISILLDISIKDLEKVLYFESYIVVNQGITPFNNGDLISEEMLRATKEKYDDENFSALIGAEAIRHMLADLNLTELKEDLQEKLKTTDSAIKKKRILKRLNLVDDFINSKNDPKWMILTVLPVIPPDIRPLVMLDGGRFAASDLNELYRRIINRNNRLKKLLQLNAPEIIIRNEYRMLQEAVDALIDNGRRGRVVKNNNKKPFKSLSDMLKGKHGRFRQNLLGKRVDYSGRSVIVAGPELRLHQCGLPKQMALELFKPFIFARMLMYGVSNIKSAKKMIEQSCQEVWDILEEVIKQHPVLLNRAPTLHRLSIQAFEPILIEGKAIQLHPLVCTAFNADFDGDQMAVHVPLSLEAQLEARVIMMSTNNIFNPASGKPIIIPDKDIILGIYYLTLEFNDEPGEGMVFNKMNTLNYALSLKYVSLHSKIKFHMQIGDQWVMVDTTPGRLILGQLLPDNALFLKINRVIIKKDISGIIDAVYRHYGQEETVKFIDKLKDTGFKYATLSGISFGINDMIIPDTKIKHIKDTLNEVEEFEQQYSDGLITYGEKYNKVVDIWSHCTDQVSSDLMKSIEHGNKDIKGLNNQQKLNSIHVMMFSGARGAPAQVKQICGMRGLMVKSSGAIIPKPILSSFVEGLSVMEYLISIHGTRKGLSDTALKTATSGYLTRRLVDVAQDCTIVEENCKTDDGIVFKPIIEGGEIVVDLSDQVLGRCVSGNIYHPLDNSLIVKASEVIDEHIMQKISIAGIDSIKVRSVLTCKSNYGVCARCYGRDLATGELVSIGQAVGVIAAQSIGEPGTQLTMRTFHIGGAATKVVENSFIEAPFDAKVKLVNHNVLTNSENNNIVMSRVCELMLVDEKGYEKVKYKVPYGANLLVNDNDLVKKGQKVAIWDPYTIPIIAEKSGKVAFRDIHDDISVKEIANEATGVVSKVVIETRHHSTTKINPRVILLDENNEIIILSNGLEAKYELTINAILNVEDNMHIKAGDIIARIPRESTKTKDIIGGLPRVIELVEARKPQNSAIIADEDGKIEFIKDYRSKRKILLHPLDGRMPIEYVVPREKHVIVSDGDIVRKSDVIVDGHLVLQDILRVMGLEALASYIVKEIQSVYRLQGVKIDDKHIEVIIKQMLKKGEIVDSGDTNFLVGDKLDISDIKEINKKMTNKGLNPAEYVPILQGITKASLKTNSFISAASFQETTRVLTDAAVVGKVDELRGLKENVITGQLIPAGTGLYSRVLHSKVRAKK